MVSWLILRIGSMEDVCSTRPTILDDDEVVLATMHQERRRPIQRSQQSYLNPKP